MKKILSIILCILVFTATLPVVVFAADTNYTDCANAAVLGTDYDVSDDGLVFDVYTVNGYCKAILTIDQNLSKQYTLNVHNDLDFDGMAIPKVGTLNSKHTASVRNFTLDGNGHTLSNLVIKGEGGFHIGLVRSGINLTVRNLTVDNAFVDGENDNGVAVITGDCMGGTFENITVKNSTLEGYGKVGPVIGLDQDENNPFLLKNITCDNNLVRATYNCGGVVGLFKRTDRVEYENVKVTNDVFETIHPWADFYSTLDSDVACDGSNSTCIKSGIFAADHVHGFYWRFADYYWGGYAKYWVVYGKTSHDCVVDPTDGYATEIANSDLVVNTLEKDVTHELTLVEGKAATCQNTGVKDYYICNCGIKLVETEEGLCEFWTDDVLATPVDPDNHVNVEVRNAVVADCKNEGYTGDKYCSDCDALLEEGEVTPVDPDNHIDNDNNSYCDNCDKQLAKRFYCKWCIKYETKKIKGFEPIFALIHCIVHFFSELVGKGWYA